MSHLHFFDAFTRLLICHLIGESLQTYGATWYVVIPLWKLFRKNSKNVASGSLINLQYVTVNVKVYVTLSNCLVSCYREWRKDLKIILRNFAQKKDIKKNDEDHREFSGTNFWGFEKIYGNSQGRISGNDVQICNSSHRECTNTWLLIAHSRHSCVKVVPEELLRTCMSKLRVWH